MTLELSQVYNLRRSDENAVVGPLAHEGVAYLRATTNTVKVCGNSIRHFYERNRSISEFEIITMSFGLTHGLFIADSSNPFCLIINYVYPDSGRRYKMAIKVANSYSELWVSTFHKLKPGQTKPMLRKGVTIKTHD